LPGAMPGILSGLRVSLAIAIILLVAAEMLGAEYGIGAYILEAGSLYDLERLFAGVAILSALGVGVSFAVGWVERRVLRWRREKSVKQFGMCSDTYEDDTLFVSLIDQKKVTANVTFAVINPFALQRMISPFWAQRAFILDQQHHDLFQSPHVIAARPREPLPVFRKPPRVIDGSRQICFPPCVHCSRSLADRPATIAQVNQTPLRESYTV